MIIKIIRVGILKKILILITFLSTKCKYYSEGCFQKDYDQIKNGFLIVHFNAGSMSKTLKKIICFLENLNHIFDVIVISATWLQDVNIPRYKISHQLRLDKQVRGCSIFVKDELPTRVNSYTVILVDNIFTNNSVVNIG